MPSPSVLLSDGEKVGTKTALDVTWEVYQYNGREYLLQRSRGWVHRISENGGS